LVDVVSVVGETNVVRSALDDVEVELALSLAW
jgi:hypothetical protein